MQMKHVFSFQAAYSKISERLIVSNAVHTDFLSLIYPQHFYTYCYDEILFTLLIFTSSKCCILLFILHFSFGLLLNLYFTYFCVSILFPFATIFVWTERFWTVISPTEEVSQFMERTQVSSVGIYNGVQATNCIIHTNNYQRWQLMQI